MRITLQDSYKKEGESHGCMELLKSTKERGEKLKEQMYERVHGKSKEGLQARKGTV